MSSENKFILTTYDVGANVKQIDEALAYLKSFEDPKVLINDVKAVSALTYIRNLITLKDYKQYPNAWQVFLKHNFEQTICKLLNFIAENLDELLTNDAVYMKLDAYEDIIFAMVFIVSTSIDFRLEFFKKGGLKAYLNLLSNQKYMDRFKNTVTLNSMTMVINWMSKNSDLYKKEWIELKAPEILLKVARESQTSRLYAYMAFLNIADDKEIETQPEVQVIIPEVVKHLKNGANDIQNSIISRESMQFLEDDDPVLKVYDVYFVLCEDNVRLSIPGIILALYGVCVNNKIKFEVFKNHELLAPIRVLVFKGSDIEQKYALRLLAQLCFDANVADIVSQDIELKDYIEKSSKNQNFAIKSVPKICEQIIWSLQQKNRQVEQSKELESGDRQKQVMISYNSASRELCLKIKSELEKNGLKVWIDVSEIHGSSLEAMARAVESSDFILMCVTEKYRQSINCQAEAQYAFKLKKKIIPIIMQAGYENADGWMGIIMGDKIFINFTRYAFDEAMRRLLHETALNFNNDKKENFGKVDAPSYTSAPAPAPIKSKVDNWSEEDVQKWFDENSVNQKIREALSPCNGQLLEQVHCLLREAPEFFYQSIAMHKGERIEFRSILTFTLNLKKLFA